MNDDGDDSEQCVERAINVLLEGVVSDEDVVEGFVNPLLEEVQKILRTAEAEMDAACRYHGYDQVNLELSLRRVREEDRIVDTLAVDFRADEYDADEGRFIRQREEAYRRHPEHEGLVVFPHSVAELTFSSGAQSIDCAVLHYMSDDLRVRKMYCETDDVLQAMRNIFLTTILPFEAEGRKVSVTNMHYFAEPSFNREGRFFYVDKIDENSSVGLSFFGRRKNEVPRRPRTYHTDHDVSKAWKEYLFEKL